MPMDAMRPWPEMADADQWLIALMEQLLDETSQSPEQLHARARELRDEAARTEIDGYRTAALALADRYEQAAALRVSTS